MKKAIIIGATSGIGKALAILYASHDYKVGVTGRRGDLLTELVAAKPDQFYASCFDVTKDSLEKKLDLLVQELGGLDLLIFSAGIGELNETLETELEIPTTEVNVTAFNKAVIWAYHYFERQKAGQIAVISSIAGLRGSAIAPAYNASKAYQINYLEGLRQKIKQKNLPIHITDIRPGFVATAMAKGDKQFWVSTPVKAASQIFNAIKAKKTVIYITKRWRIIAWVLKLLPGFLYERM